jgi:hypothetical protein
MRTRRRRATGPRTGRPTGRAGWLRRVADPCDRDPLDQAGRVPGSSGRPHDRRDERCAECGRQQHQETQDPDRQRLVLALLDEPEVPPGRHVATGRGLDHQRDADARPRLPGHDVLAGGCRALDHARRDARLVTVERSVRREDVARRIEDDGERRQADREWECQLPDDRRRCLARLQPGHGVLDQLDLRVVGARTQGVLGLRVHEAGPDDRDRGDGQEQGESTAQRQLRPHGPLPPPARRHEPSGWRFRS